MKIAKIQYEILTAIRIPFEISVLKARRTIFSGRPNKYTIKRKKRLKSPVNALERHAVKIVNNNPYKIDVIITGL